MGLLKVHFDSKIENTKKSHRKKICEECSERRIDNFPVGPYIIESVWKQFGIVSHGDYCSLEWFRLLIISRKNFETFSRDFRSQEGC